MPGWIDSSGVLAKWEGVHAAMEANGGKVDAATFAEASSCIITIFDLISGMGTAKGDMEGNAKTVAKWGAEKGGAIQDIVLAEIAAGNLKKLIGDGKTATCALLWLVRALTFIKVMVKELADNRSKAMKDCVSDGYAASLKPHHGMIVKGVFAAAVKMAPARDKFVEKLDDSEDACWQKISGMMPQFGAVLDNLTKFCEENQIK